jgi:hypothetical protein
MMIYPLLNSSLPVGPVVISSPSKPELNERGMQRSPEPSNGKVLTKTSIHVGSVVDQGQI